MNKIISKEHFSEKVFKLEIEAPLIARSRKAGQRLTPYAALSLW